MFGSLSKLKFSVPPSSPTQSPVDRILRVHHLVAVTTVLVVINPTSSLATPLASEPSQVYAQVPPALPRPDFQRPAPEPNKPLQPNEPPQPVLPPSQDIIPATPAPNLPGKPSNPTEFPNKITVQRFEIIGNTVLTQAELAKITSAATNKPLDFAQLLQVTSDITQLYVSKGYVNSGAYLPGNQSFDTQNAVVRIEIIEGRVEDIVITGTQRLNPNYIRSRIGLGAVQPLKLDRLIASLQLLQLDPLIKSISTELVAGKEPGTSVVQIKVSENPTWRAGVNIANNRTPSIGEIQAQAAISQNNLFGLGDGIGVSYAKTEGSNAFDVNYTLPLNPRNGTLRLQYSNSNSRVVEPPFDRLDIKAKSQDISLTYRQPIIQTPAQEFAMGVTLTRRKSNTVYLQSVIGEAIPYPVAGIDANGNTLVTAARFFQDYSIRDSQQVFATRSQLSVGINAFNATIAPSSPDSQFVSWRGQAQYVRALAPNSTFLVKLESQLADRPLLSLEQIGLGGQDTVRGYRQDLLLGDNGLLASAEARFPVFTPPGSKQVLQIVPFIDFGVAWNKSNNTSIAPNTIASGGLGLRYQSNDDLLVKLDYGIPFTTIDSTKPTGQEKGFYFSVNYNRSF
jgi:hemolysin activation/secretion protein